MYVPVMAFLFVTVALIAKDTGKISRIDPSEHVKPSCGALVDAVECRDKCAPGSGDETVPDTVQAPPVEGLVTDPVTVVPV